jgi:hypothetical protein
MADKKTDPAGKAPKKKGGKASFVLILILFGVSAPLLMPTWTLVLIGMLPTFVALITDNDPQKSSTGAVGAMNFAGLAPFILDLWMKGQTMENAMHVLRESSSWLIILGAAAVGQMIVFAVPQAMTSLTLAHAESRLKILKKNLEQLQVSWGPDVANTKPLDKIGKE